MSKKRFEPKFKIKKGDTVMVLTGNDKGNTGEVLAVYPEKSRVLVKDVNIVKKHTKPSANNPEGGIHEKPAPIHISNVALIDPKSNKATRVGIKREDGKVQRIAKKSGEVI